MLRAETVAQYFLSKDPNREVFTKNLIIKNGRKFYDGNARLNKYLHLSQNIYIAKTGEKLFSDDMYAYDNGAVVLDVQENYSLLHSRHFVPDLPESYRIFLDELYDILGDASLDELIGLSHEDNEWVDKHLYYRKNDQRMDSMSRVDEYRKQYSDILLVMELDMAGELT